MSKQALKRVRRALKMEVSRKPLDAYAWPGGYQLFYLCADGGILCPTCANEEIVLIDAALRAIGTDKQWEIQAYDADWEGPGWDCDHCGKHFDSEYGDPEAEGSDDL